MKAIKYLSEILVLALLLAPGTPAHAQKGSIKVSGNVLDEANLPVPGATVLVKDSPTFGAVTDANGAFSITVPAGSVLVVSCIGYADQEKAFSKSGEWFVTLAEDTLMLEDVIVVGYGTQKKESVVGSISQVGSDALVNSGTTNITNAIAGKLAGVLTFQSSGQPGAKGKS